MKHLLLAGHGFVGKVTAELFRKNGWRVTTLSRSGNADKVADIASLESLQQLAQDIEPPTHVIHCASASGGGAEVYRSVYLDGVKNLSEAFPNAQLLFTSSTSVYPQTDGSIVSEDAELVSNRETGVLLVKAEEQVLKAGGIVARLAGVYGNGRSYMLRRFLAGEATMEEQGERILNFTHNQDAASALLFLCESSAEAGVYNVCDSTPRSQRETYALLAEKFNLPMPPSAPRNLNSKRGWTHKAVSNAKMRALGWEPKYPSLLDAAEEVVASLGKL